MARKTRFVPKTAIAANPAVDPDGALRDVVEPFHELLVMPDPGAVLVTLGAMVANYADGDPVWLLLVAPPGSGKTEIITALSSAPHVEPLSSLTPKTLISGYEAAGQIEPSSLLEQADGFLIVAFKDLTTVLSLPQTATAKI